MDQQGLRRGSASSQSSRNIASSFRNSDTRPPPTISGMRNCVAGQAHVWLSTWLCFRNGPGAGPPLIACERGVYSA